MSNVRDGELELKEKERRFPAASIDAAARANPICSVNPSKRLHKLRCGEDIPLSFSIVCVDEPR
jgi:hypothetical protein